MSARAAESRPSAHWGLIATLAIAAAAALYFVKANAVRYLSYDAAAFGEEFWSRRFGLLPHLAGGATAISAGLVQLWLGLTGRVGRLHRNVGRLYLGGVVVGCLGGYYLSFTAVNPPGWTYRVGLFFLTVAWTVTTAVAYVAIRNRKVEQHRDWMIRSYTVTFAFVTFRLLDRVLEAWGIGPFEDRQRMLIWLCWAVPLLLVSAILEFSRSGRRGA
ncbi:MAG TPA: DUF2306 domain-containing protein [Steroidobacteraceae bacterium]|nr:DUF2306 domain-containing protein [Steroidobacteraceae bacterium]